MLRKEIEVKVARVKEWKSQIEDSKTTYIKGSTRASKWTEEPQRNKRKCFARFDNPTKTAGDEVLYITDSGRMVQQRTLCIFIPHLPCT